MYSYFDRIRYISNANKLASVKSAISIIKFTLAMPTVNYNSPAKLVSTVQAINFVASLFSINQDGAFWASLAV